MTENIKDGLVTYWYENGNKEMEKTYKDGRLDGKHILYYNQGTKDGILYGEYHPYYKSGKKWREDTYKDGELDGLSTCWWSTGWKKWEGNYKNEKQDGLWTGWYKYGRKYSERLWKDGKVVNVIGLWNEDGSVRE